MRETLYKVLGIIARVKEVPILKEFIDHLIEADLQISISTTTFQVLW